MERVVVEVALLRRSNLDRAFCSLVFKPLIAGFQCGDGWHSVKPRSRGDSAVVEQKTVGTQ
jgi:hypothetical protein